MSNAIRKLYRRMIYFKMFTNNSGILIPPKLSPSVLLSRVQFLYVSRYCSTGLPLDQRFEESQKKLSTLISEPDNDTKLKLYGLFKQATLGNCNTESPGALNFMANAKWKAWNCLQNMTQEKAKELYVSTAHKLLAVECNNQTTQWESAIQIPDLLVERKLNFLQITLNCPEKKNRFSFEMMKGITNILNTSAKDDSISFVVFRGKGDYYSSGIDVSYFKNSPDVRDMAGKNGELSEDYVLSYIEYPKPLIALINGPALGIAVTVLGMFDLVYAAESASFQTPFSLLGISPEGCSTYTFPKIMGYAAANRILMLSQKVSAGEAHRLGLVSEVYPDSVFEKEVEERLFEMSALPKKSLAYVRQETRSTEIDILKKVCYLELKLLKEIKRSEDFKQAIAKFFVKKK